MEVLPAQALGDRTHARTRTRTRIYICARARARTMVDQSVCVDMHVHVRTYACSRKVTSVTSDTHTHRTSALSPHMGILAYVGFTVLMFFVWRRLLEIQEQLCQVSY